MPNRSTALAIVLLAAAILFSVPTPTPAQVPANPEYYLRIDGSTNPPRILATNLAPAPTVVRKASGRYEVTFHEELEFLVGMSEGVAFGHYQSQNTLLMATRDRRDVRQWDIHTVELHQGDGSSARTHFRGRDTTFNLIVRPDRTR
jgi:hypothetical protein